MNDNTLTIDAGQLVSDPLDAYTGNDAKALGAYYTDSDVAKFIVRWAVRSGNETVLDPSFGDGAFLRVASERIAELGGNSPTQVFGVELDPDVHSETSSELDSLFGTRKSHLRRADFFDVEPHDLAPVDAVVGNPPFIRFHRFSGRVREKAIECADAQGVQLSNLISSWAPFVVHATGMLRDGGRMGFVLPMEIGYAAYARPILKFLYETFNDVTFLTFQRKLFPQLNEDTIVVLASGKDGGPANFFLRDFEHPYMLRSQALADESTVYARASIDGASLSSGSRRLVENLVPVTVRELYSDLKKRDHILRMKQFADVGIGYVSGHNEFFHLSSEAVRQWRIPDCYLLRAVRRGRSLGGSLFTSSDWELGLDTGETSYLLSIGSSEGLPVSVRDYIEHGKEQGVLNRYKCRNREPWYRVPHVHKADALLTYMSGDAPKLVANHANAVAPNSLHIVRLSAAAPLSPTGLAASWRTSLTRLSAEIEGHSLGGGMLKIEPTEADRILIATPTAFSRDYDDLCREIDGLLRKSRLNCAEELANKVLLIEGLGLTRSECRILSAGADLLKTRRRERGAGGWD